MDAQNIACICVPTAVLLAAWWDFPLDAVSHILFPYCINRAAFAAVYYAACGILWVLESFVTIYEFAFGSFMKRMILSPFRASGVGALASKICWEFFSVPQQLETFLEWRAARVAATIGGGSFLVGFFLDLCSQSGFRRELRRSFCLSVFKIIFCSVSVITCIADIVVFAILVANLLLPLLCIFAALALMSYTIFRARSSLRPKYTAPCLAVLAAACLHFNTDAFDDWMVPFFTMVAGLWLLIVVVNRHLSTCLSHVMHWLRCICSRCSSAFIPRVRARDGGHFTPQGGRLFCDDECAICMEPMHGHEVSARKWRQRCV
jgi:hypothetical protein